MTCTEFNTPTAIPSYPSSSLVGDGQLSKDINNDRSSTNSHVTSYGGFQSMDHLSWIKGMYLDMEFLSSEDKRVIQQLYNEYVKGN